MFASTPDRTIVRCHRTIPQPSGNADNANSLAHLPKIGNPKNWGSRLCPGKFAASWPIHARESEWPSRTLFLCISLPQRFLDQAANRLGLGRLGIGLGIDPAIERGKLIGLQTDHYWRPPAGRLRTTFLWYRSFLTTHRNYDIRETSRREVGASLQL